MLPPPAAAAVQSTPACQPTAGYLRLALHPLQQQKLKLPPLATVRSPTCAAPSTPPTPLCSSSSRRAAAAAMTTAAAMQFWAAPVCPYAQRGWIALKETGAPHDYCAVDLHDKSPEFVALYRKVVCDDAANAKVGAAALCVGVCGGNPTLAGASASRCVVGLAAAATPSLTASTAAAAAAAAAGPCPAAPLPPLPACLPAPGAGACAGGRGPGDHRVTRGGRVCAEEVRQQHR